MRSSTVGPSRPTSMTRWRASNERTPTDLISEARVTDTRFTRDGRPDRSGAQPTFADAFILRTHSRETSGARPGRGSEPHMPSSTPTTQRGCQRGPDRHLYGLGGLDGARGLLAAKPPKERIRELDDHQPRLNSPSWDQEREMCPTPRRPAASRGLDTARQF
jgi:hypothetical protein